MSGIVQDVANNPVTLTVGDGAGGVQVITIADFGSIGSIGFDYSEFGLQQVLLALLQSIWGNTCAKTLGVMTTPVSGTGNGTVGTV